jgi:hypothetical protein
LRLAGKTAKSVHWLFPFPREFATGVTRGHIVVNDRKRYVQLPRHVFVIVTIEQFHDGISALLHHERLQTCPAAVIGVQMLGEPL